MIKNINVMFANISYADKIVMADTDTTSQVNIPPIVSQDMRERRKERNGNNSKSFSAASRSWRIIKGIIH